LRVERCSTKTIGRLVNKTGAARPRCVHPNPHDKRISGLAGQIFCLPIDVAEVVEDAKGSASVALLNGCGSSGARS
jgi:hypothetical protein